MSQSGSDEDEVNHVLTALALEEMRRHGLSPWFYHSFKLQGYEGRLPHNLMEMLQQDFSINLLSAALQQNEIQTALTALATRGLDFILLKGVDLRQRVYRDPALRFMADLDLLMAPEDFSTAEEVLKSLGYRTYQGYLDQRLRINEVVFLPPAGKSLPLDLHWGITAAFHFYYLPYQPLRAEAVPVNYYGIPAFHLSPEHLLIHLCLHAYEHLPTFSQFLDLALVLSRLSINWPKVLRETSRFGCQAPVYLLLRELAPIVPGMVPVAALAQLAGYQPGWVERIVLQRRLRYLTLALPFFYRHRSLRSWLNFLSASLWPGKEVVETLGHKGGRRPYLLNLLRKFIHKLDAV
jgi:hypothetical protein